MNLKRKILALSLVAALCTTSTGLVQAAGWTQQGNVVSNGVAQTPAIDIYNGTPYLVYGDETISRKATVKKLVGDTWETVGVEGFSATPVLTPKIKIAEDGTIYVAYRVSTNDGVNSGALNAIVMKYDGESWTQVGDAVSSEAADYLTLAMDGNTPYVAYRTGKSKKATVKKYDGQNWVSVGEDGFTPGEIGSASLYVYEGTPYLAFKDKSNSNKLSVMRYTGTSWSMVGEAGISSDEAIQAQLYVYNGKPYVAYADAKQYQKATVKRYTGLGWETVGTEGFSAGAAYDIALSVEEGFPVVAYEDGGNNSKLTVKKFNGTDWITIGTDGFTDGRTDAVTIEVDGKKPYVAYKDFSDEFTAKVVMFDETLDADGTKPDNEELITTVPSAPQSVIVDEITEESVSISWSASQNDGGSTIKGYNVYVDGNKVNTELITSTSYTIENLSLGTTYEITVKAENEKGESEASSVVRATPAKKLTKYDMTIVEESFEDDFAVDSTPGFSGTATVSTDTANKGSQSIALTADDTLSYTVDPAVSAEAEIWFYDDTSIVDGDANFATVLTDKTSTSPVYVGLRSGQNGVDQNTYYCYGLGSTWYQSEVQRTTGWHNVKYKYIDGNNVAVYFDGVRIFTTNTGTFEGISKLDMQTWGTSANFYVDDLTITSLEEIEKADWLANFEYGELSWTATGATIATEVDPTNEYNKVLKADVTGNAAISVSDQKIIDIVNSYEQPVLRAKVYVENAGGTVSMSAKSASTNVTLEAGWNDLLLVLPSAGDLTSISFNTTGVTGTMYIDDLTVEEAPTTQTVNGFEKMFKCKDYTPQIVDQDGKHGVRFDYPAGLTGGLQVATSDQALLVGKGLEIGDKIEFSFYSSKPVTNAMGYAFKQGWKWVNLPCWVGNMSAGQWVTKEMVITEEIAWDLSFGMQFNPGSEAGYVILADVKVTKQPKENGPVLMDDVANKVTGMTEGMEYNLDGQGYVAYDKDTFDALDLSGDHTLFIKGGDRCALYPFKFTSFNVTNTTPVGSVEAGKTNKVTLTINNDLYENKDYSFIVAVYSGDSLVNVHAVNGKLEKGIVELENDIDIPAGGEYTVKYYLWDGMAGMQPLTEAEEIPVF